MSYPSAPPRLQQIDVIEQVGRAYRTVLDNVQPIIEMALLPYLIVLAAVLVVGLLPLGMFGAALAGLVHALAFLVFGGVFMVRWYRFLLLGETVGAGLIPPGWAPFVIAGIKLGAIIAAGWIVLGLIGMLPPHIITAPLMAIGGIALTLAALRVSLIFPAAAVECPIAMRTAWDWIEGNYWRLFACALASYLPFVIAEMIVGSLGGALSFLWIVFEALRLVLSFLGTAVIGALLSQLYRDVGGNSAPI